MYVDRLIPVAPAVASFNELRPLRFRSLTSLRRVLLASRRPSTKLPETVGLYPPHNNIVRTSWKHGRREEKRAEVRMEGIACDEGMKESGLK